MTRAQAIELKTAEEIISRKVNGEGWVTGCEHNRVTLARRAAGQRYDAVNRRFAPLEESDARQELVGV